MFLNCQTALAHSPKSRAAMRMERMWVWAGTKYVGQAAMTLNTWCKELLGLSSTRNNEEETSYAINVLFSDDYFSGNTEYIQRNLDGCTKLWRICIKGSQHCLNQDLVYEWTCQVKICWDLQQQGYRHGVVEVFALLLRNASLLCNRKQISINIALTTHEKRRLFWDCFIKTFWIFMILVLL
jgi:hypothetical protein